MKKETFFKNFLFHDDEIERKSEILYDMWLKRKIILKHMAEVKSLMKK